MEGKVREEQIKDDLDEQRRPEREEALVSPRGRRPMCRGGCPGRCDDGEAFWALGERRGRGRERARAREGGERAREREGEERAREGEGEGEERAER